MYCFLIFMPHFAIIYCYGLNHVLPHSHAGVLTPRTSGRDLNWRRSLYRANEVNRRSLGGPQANATGVLLERASLDTDTHRENVT